MLVRLVPLAGACAGASLLAACGGSTTASLTASLVAPSTSSSSTASSASTQAPSTASGGLDTCVVGTWRSAATSGSVTGPDGVKIPLSGGEGVVSTIAADGTVHTDYGASRPQTGRGSDGSTYAIQYSGTLTAHLHAAGGRATLTIDPGSDATVTVTKDGATIDTEPPPTTAQPSTYTCVPHRSLVVTANLVSVAYVAG